MSELHHLELHHLGLDPASVPPGVVLVASGLAERIDLDLQPGTVVTRREYRSGRSAAAPEVLVCSGARGAPAAVIALEELRRAGARAVVALTCCECSRCETGAPGAHGLTVPRGAVRDDGTSTAYAPQDFPAVPDHHLAVLVADHLETPTTQVVRTVDVPPRWHPRPAEDDGPVDLESAALLVAAAAGGIAATTVVVGAAADSGDLVGRVARALAGRCP